MPMITPSRNESNSLRLGMSPVLAGEVHVGEDVVAGGIHEGAEFFDLLAQPGRITPDELQDMMVGGQELVALEESQGSTV
jgi:hypothetical protein